MRKQRGIRRYDHNDRTAVLLRKRSICVLCILGNLQAHRHSGDSQVLPVAVIALHQHTDGVRAELCIRFSRRRADAAFEPVANHSRTAAHVAFFDRAAARGIDRVKSVFGLDVKAVNVVQPAVPGFRHYRERPPISRRIRLAVLHAPLNHSVAHHAHAVFVIITGPSKNPDSSTHVVPVISPLPLSDHHPENTGLFIESFPRGITAVTPVRTGPFPISSLPSPENSVVCPTATPATSVIAFSAPGAPSNGTPRSRARGFECATCCAKAATAKIKHKAASPQEVLKRIISFLSPKRPLPCAATRCSL